jgi:hypothetical protein
MMDVTKLDAFIFAFDSKREWGSEAIRIDWKALLFWRPYYIAIVGCSILWWVSSSELKSVVCPRLTERLKNRESVRGRLYGVSFPKQNASTSSTTFLDAKTRK